MTDTLAAIGGLRAAFVPIGLFNDAIATLNAANGTIAEMRSTDRKGKVTALIEGALREFKITPASKGQHEALCKTDAGLSAGRDTVRQHDVDVQVLRPGSASARHRQCFRDTRDAGSPCCPLTLMVARPFPVDPALTAISIGYRNTSTMLVADKVLPRVPVLSQDFKWTKYPIAEAFTVPNTLVSRRGQVERIEFSGSEESSSTRDYGLEDGIPQSDIDAANNLRSKGLGNFNPLDFASERITDIILLDREVRVAGLVQNPLNYAANKRLVLSGSDQFSDTGSDAIVILKSAFNGTLVFRPNTMTMGRAVWSVLSSHPAIVNACKGNVSSKGIVTPAEFVNLFSGEGLTTLNIGESFVNVARPGQAAVLNRVWGNFISLTHINEKAIPSTGGVTFGFTAQYGTRIAGQWEDKNVGLEGGQVVRVGEKVRELIVASDTGFLIQNPVANIGTGIGITKEGYVAA